MEKTIKKILTGSQIGDIVPGVKGHRAFPNAELMVPTTNPFLLLDQIGPQKVAEDFFMDGSQGYHPHRGFDTITFMFEGTLKHKDSLGNSEFVRSGEIQRMNAGKGIVHGGDFYGDPDSNRFHEVQLWVNRPANLKMSAPFIEHFTSQQLPNYQTANGVISIVSGAYQGITGPLQLAVPTLILQGKGSGIQSIVDIPEHYQSFIYVLEGSLRVQGETISEHQIIALSDQGNQLHVEAAGSYLFLAGLPIQEPVKMGGPFVMNTKEEIDTAFEEYREGKFGNITL